MSIVGGLTSGIMGSMESSGGAGAAPVGASGGLILLQTNPLGETVSGTYDPAASSIFIKHPDITVTATANASINADGWVTPASNASYALVTNIPAPVDARVYEMWGYTNTTVPASSSSAARIIFNWDVANGYLWFYELFRTASGYTQTLYENSATSGGYVSRSTDTSITVGAPTHWHVKIFDFGDRVTTTAWVYEQDTTTVDDILTDTYSVASRPLKGFYDQVAYQMGSTNNSKWYIGGWKMSDLPTPVV